MNFKDNVARICHQGPLATWVIEMAKKGQVQEPMLGNRPEKNEQHHGLPTLL